MLSPALYLRPDITRADVCLLAQWLQQEEVCRYLSESQDVSASLAGVLDRVHLPSFTHLFSQDGRFYMICTGAGQAVGYVRLLVGSAETEMVIVIGEQRNWGQKLGSQAIRESLKIAFYDLRSPKVVAKIHAGNTRSLRAFASAGFIVEADTLSGVRMVLTLAGYLARQQEMVTQAGEIILTDHDKTRLTAWIDRHFQAGVELNWPALNLDDEINKAVVIDSRNVPDDIVTMNSQAVVKINSTPLTVRLAFPEEADWSRRRVSILSPVGTAILGTREGDRFAWRLPSGRAEFRIERIIYQPEAAGDYHL